MQSQMSQKESLVELIFAKCSLVWGREFLGRWEGLNLAEVKADWLRELDKTLEHPAKVRHALENLPSKPPNVMQFRDACIAAPSAPAPYLPAPKADPKRVKEVLGGIKISANAYSKEWAHRLKAREDSGERLTAAQRTMWRAALGPQDEAGEAA